MQFISKGMVLNPSTEHILHVSRCGNEFTLTGVSAAVWLNGRLEISKPRDIQQETKLRQLIRMGLAEQTEEPGLSGVYKMLCHCVICPAKLKPLRRPLNRQEQKLWKWLSRSGLRLTMSELVYLKEQNVEPVEKLLGDSQALTKIIYNEETIAGGILDMKMEKSPVRDRTVLTLLGLLKKKRILLI